MKEKYEKVTDPAILAQLNKKSYQKVTDPEILRQLNGESTDSVPEEQEQGFLSKLPRNIAIGLMNLGRNVHNIPHDITESTENALQGIGKNFENFGSKFPMGNKNPNFLSSHLPNDTYDYAQVFGNTGTPTLMDELIQKGVEHAPELYGGGMLLRQGLRRFPLTQRMASRQLREAERLINEYGNAHLPLSEESLAAARPFLPQTHASREMLEGSRAGNYGQSFATQSQVGHHARNLAKSPLAAERLQAPVATELKQTMLNELETGLRRHGLNEVADLVRGGIHDYRTYKRIQDAIRPYIKPLGIPASFLALLGVGYKVGKKYLD